MRACGWLGVGLLLSCASTGRFPVEPGTGRVAVEEVVVGLEWPWAVAFTPDGRALVTERPGRLRWVSLDGGVGPALNGVPAVFAQGQGGLLDVALAPDFTSSREVFLTFAEPGPDGTAGTALARGVVTETALDDVRVLWRQTPKLTGGVHFGSRVVVARDGALFVTTGERNQRDLSQSLTHGQGKVLRLLRDGGVPNDNPFAGRADALPEVFSFGHRNLQGAALHPDTGALWTHEHGPQGGDELNPTEPGKNYGWPLITYGREYSGLPVGDGRTDAPGLEQPRWRWVPSIAPSGLAFVTSDRYPAWKGSALVGALAGRLLARVAFEGGGPAAEERLLTELGERIRDVRQAPDGFVYVLTDSARGRLLRLLPP